jgi:hypothetical protein
MSSISDQPAIYKNLGSDKTLQQIRGGCRASTTRSRSQCHYKVPNWQTCDTPNAKDNFAFERTFHLDRCVSVLDLRHKQ